MGHTEVKIDSLSVQRNIDSMQDKKKESQESSKGLSIFGSGVLGGLLGSYFLGGFNSPVPSDTHRILAVKLHKITKGLNNPILKNLLGFAFTASTIIASALVAAGIAYLVQEIPEKDVFRKSFKVLT